MLPMTITVVRVVAEGGFVHASIAVEVQKIRALARIDLNFPAPTGATMVDWKELAYDRALMMLDPA